MKMSFFKSLRPRNGLYEGEAVYVGKDKTLGSRREPLWFYKGRHYNVRITQNSVTLGVDVEVMDSEFKKVKAILSYPLGEVQQEWAWGEPSPARLSWHPSRESRAAVGIPPLCPAVA